MHSSKNKNRSLFPQLVQTTAVRLFTGFNRQHHFLCEVCMFSPCLHGFPTGTLASSQYKFGSFGPFTLPLGVNVSPCDCMSLYISYYDTLMTCPKNPLPLAQCQLGWPPLIYLNIYTL